MGNNISEIVKERYVNFEDVQFCIRNRNKYPFVIINTMPANAMRQAENQIHLIKKLICTFTIQLPSSSWSPIVRYISLRGLI